MEKYLEQFIKKIEKTFISEKKNNRNYFVGYSIKEGKKTRINIIIDDRDVERMSKSELLEKLQDILNDANPLKNKINAKPVVISDLNNKNIWSILEDSCVIKNTKALTIFLDIKLPKDFQTAFEKVPEKFKLEDLRRELRKITKRDYHRNTYQNWLNLLKKAEFISLKEKTYYKTRRINRDLILKNLKEKDN